MTAYIEPGVLTCALHRAQTARVDFIDRLPDRVRQHVGRWLPGHSMENCELLGQAGDAVRLPADTVPAGAHLFGYGQWAVVLARSPCADGIAVGVRVETGGDARQWLSPDRFPTGYAACAPTGPRGRSWTTPGDRVHEVVPATLGPGCGRPDCGSVAGSVDRMLSLGAEPDDLAMAVTTAWGLTEPGEGRLTAAGQVWRAARFRRVLLDVTTAVAGRRGELSLPPQRCRDLMRSLALLGRAAETGAPPGSELMTVGRKVWHLAGHLIDDEANILIFRDLIGLP
jgi:hypothetical protein